jgi:hypothetical protein
MFITQRDQSIQAGRPDRVDMQVATAQSKQITPDPEARTYVESLLSRGTLRVKLNVPDHVDTNLLKKAVKDALVHLAETKQGMQLIRGAVAGNGLTLSLRGNGGAGSATYDRQQNIASFDYRMFLEQVYLVDGSKCTPVFGGFVLGHEFAHAAAMKEGLDLSRTDDEERAVDLTDIHIRQSNAMKGTNYQVRESYEPLGQMIFVGDGRMMSGSTVAESRASAIAARYRPGQSALGVAGELRGQLAPFEGLFQYRFRKELASASSPREIQARGALDQLRTMIDQLEAREAAAPVPLDSAAVRQALDAYEARRTAFLNTLK